MSIDPETARQIEELARDDRPLLVLDVDEVVLEFVAPFMAFLEAQGLQLRTDTFRLHGNVFRIADEMAVEDAMVTTLLDDFFDGQDAWQTMAFGAADVVHRIAREAEVVMLTAMPHRFRNRRRALLDHLGLPYPMLTTEAAKGPALARLRGDTPRPVAFVDDIVHNLVSARNFVPDIHLVHLMAHEGLKGLLPPLPANVHAADSWEAAEPHLVRVLGLQQSG